MEDYCSAAESVHPLLKLSKASLFTEKQWHNIEKSRLLYLKDCRRDKDSAVEDEVFASWERSQQNGVDPAGIWLRLKISDEEFQRTYLAYEYIIKLTIPLVTMADDLGVCGDYIIELIGANGVSLFQAGDLKLHDFATEKSIFNESTMGTNAHSLCMRYRKPYQIIGPEHYCEALHNLAATAVPIIDDHNNTTASLLLTRQLPNEPWSRENQKLLLHTMSLVVGLAARIEAELRYQQCYTRALELEHEVQKLSPVGKKMTKPESGYRIDEHNNFGGDASEREDNNTVYRSEKGNTRVKDAQADIGENATITFDDILGKSAAISRAIDLAKRYAQSNENILLVGESGTGKEYFAQAMHNSSRKDGPFMSINCAAIPYRLIESELFGYEHGTFTGAQRGGKAGKIELANGGTLFLDEIGDMPLELQATLLRVLENKRVMRLGGKSYKQVDFRLMAATNRDLSQLVQEMRFREDLYYRLATLCIELPPLRKRPDDLNLFIQFYLDELKTENGIKREFSSEALSVMRAFSWPGNARHLKNAILSSCYAARNELVEVDDLPRYLLFDNSLVSGDDLSLHQIEKTAIKTALTRTDYNVAKAAELLNISRATLYRKFKEYNLVNAMPNCRSKEKAL